MKIKEISYVLGPKDLINDCLDVMVFLEDEYCNDAFVYVVEVTTPQCLSRRMEKSESEFLSPSYPYILVLKLTDEIIEAAIQSFIDTDDDSYWLKLYHIPATLNIEDINEILYRKKQENMELKARIDANLD
uniref:Uncharacterized protein n=1 Tax=Navicula veneta TaxID=138539 RepID=A0A8F0WGS9_9STRA|nr:hypothetical protein KYX03_pgp116 [Navicula veneta]QWM93713.1 hypothetical protein [Navicula veneta]